MDLSELRKALESESDGSKQTEIIQNILKEDNVSSKVSAIPQKQFEDSFNPDVFNTLLEHSDPNLKALASFMTNGSEEFQNSVLDCTLKHLQTCYKSKEFENGSKGLNVIIKFLASNSRSSSSGSSSTKKSLGSALCERILSIVALYNSASSTNITSQVVVITAKCIELNYDYSSSTLQSIIENLITEDSKDSLITAFSTLASLFHINSTISQQIFLLPQIQKQQFTQAHFVSEQVVVAALEALSAACVDKQCRSQVAVNFDQVVNQALKNENNKQRVALLAASIWVKTKATTDTDPSKRDENVKEIVSLSELFESTIAENKEEERYLTVALEGLAYTSLLTLVKKRIVKNENLVKRLVEIVDKNLQQTPWVYCSLCILSNVTEYTNNQSPEQQKMKDLKSYAGKASVESDKEDDSIVTSRNKQILDNSNIVAIISRNCPRFTQSSRATAAVLLRNLVTERTHRSNFAKQGGLAVVIYLLVPVENTPSLDSASTAIATSALAKTIITVDPEMALSNKVSPVVVVKPLCEQLSSDGSNGSLLDTFEALLALTNVASSKDDALRRAIVSNAFSKIENLLTSSNTLVQRATVELICNLSMSPHCAVKFLDSSGPANSRLDILAILTDTDDRKTCLAAAGALATFADFPPAGDVMMARDKLVDKLVQLLINDDQELVLRGIVALESMKEVQTFKSRLEKFGGIEKVKKLAHSSRAEEVKEVAISITESL